MILAVASGKGGTGKTTVSASLASVWPGRVTAVDLDVEEPNLHLFLQPEMEGEETAWIMVPEVDEAHCTHCGVCAEACQFKAITVLGEVILTFPEMCHGCHACLELCPEKVISAGRRELGQVLRGRAGDVAYLGGRLRVGEAMSPPLIRQVQDALAGLAGDAVLDCPPGVSCPAVKAVSTADAIILVTEPTPFGLHDLDLAHRAFTPAGAPMGVVINRHGQGDDGVERFCADRGLPVLARLPYDRRVAEAYSRGEVVARMSGAMDGLFRDLAARARELAGKTGRAVHV